MRWKISKISLITILTLILVNWIVYVDCPQTNAFSDFTISNLLTKPFFAVIAGFVWTIGYILFLNFEAKHTLIKKYFVWLTIVASFPILTSIWNNTLSSNRQLMSGICNKSSDDGMFCSMDWLTFDEYEYLHKNANWLPPLPSNSESIKITYYRDNFLGDYHLHVWTELPYRPQFDSTEFSHLKKVKIDETNPLENDMLYTKKTQSGENIYHFSAGSSD